MSTNNPVRLVHSDIVKDCAIYTSATPDTDITYLKNQYRSQVTVWPSPVVPLHITGTSSINKVADSFSMIRHNLNGLAYAYLTLYDDEYIDGVGFSGTQVYNSGAIQVSEQEPLGVWRFGVDPFGTGAFTGEPFTIWLEQPVIFRSWRITFIWDDYTDLPDTEITTLFFGMTTKLQESISWGAKLTTLRASEGVITGSGGYELLSNQLEGKVLSLPLENMSDNDARALHDFQRKVRNEYFFVSAYPESGYQWQDKLTSFLGRLENPIEFSRKFFDWQSADNIIISEV